MTHNGLGGSAYSIELYVREIFILPILLDAARGLVAWAVRPAGVAPAKITSTFGDIHARVPIVTVDEQRALQPENATADAEQWAAIRDLNGSPAANREHLVAKVNDDMCPQVLLRVRHPLRLKIGFALSKLKVGMGRYLRLQQGRLT